MRNETIRRLMERREQRRRQRIVRRVKTIASILYLAILIGCLIAMEFPVKAFPKDTPKAKYTAVTVDFGTEPVINLGEFKITHYCPCSKCCGKWADGITATGTIATEGRTIAVDPNVIPYGTKVTIRYTDGTEHTYIAEDSGSAIEGNRIDVFMNSHEAAWNAGIRYGDVYLEGYSNDNT
jgi:3D (Asp-Asp-Asp) domain-containing protein